MIILLVDIELEARFSIIYDRHDDTPDNKRPLYNNGRQKHVDTECSVAISLQKRHQKSKTDEDHHMYILKGCNERNETTENMIQSNLRLATI